MRYVNYKGRQAVKGLMSHFGLFTVQTTVKERDGDPFDTLNRYLKQQLTEVKLYDSMASYLTLLLLLGMIAKLRKATISCLMPTRPPVHMEELGFHWTDFHEIQKSYEERRPTRCNN
jgi:hypothetical protein